MSGGGSGVTWFIVLYLIAAYIKRYGQSFRWNYRKFGFLYLVGVLLVSASKYCIALATQLILHETVGTSIFYGYNSPFIVISSIALFLYFERKPEIKYGMTSAISKVAASTFGVYLIHDNPLLRPVLWSLFNVNTEDNVILFIMYLIAIIFIIFIGSVVIDLLRMVLFSLFGIDRTIIGLGLREREQNKMRKEINIEEKKKILLQMLEEIDEFCANNDISYFLVGGTLLGAIRHNGFIPWDDDIDIGMPRADYNRFIKIYKSKSGTIEIRHHSNSKNHIWPAAKAINNKTILIENNNKRNSIGLFIDIFPFDKVAGTFDEVKKKQKKITVFKKILDLKYFQIVKDRSLLKNIVVVLGRLLRIIPNKLFFLQIDKLSVKDQFSDNCKYLCNFVGAWESREIANIHDFDEIIKHQFENKMFSIPKGYDDYLTTVYGDYMTPPPVEKQVTHHSNVVYWR